jgi:hypothetical protein
MADNSKKPLKSNLKCISHNWPKSIRKGGQKRNPTCNFKAETSKPTRLITKSNH